MRAKMQLRLDDEYPAARATSAVIERKRQLALQPTCGDSVTGRWSRVSMQHAKENLANDIGRQRLDGLFLMG